MADLDELFGPSAWGPIQDQLRRGEDPEISELAQALRGDQPVPEEVRLYVADLLENKKKRKRGPKVDRSDRWKLRYLWVTSEVVHWIEVCKRAQRLGIPLQGGVHATAREKVSKRTGIPESTIDNIYYGRKWRENAV
jgi:hypothetical protein